MIKSEAQHTPGPWKAVEAPYNPAGWLWVQNGPGALLADVHQNKNIPLEARNANARLMAAAPEMLAALEYYAADSSINGEVARAVVAKALGGE
jgi:hypothetical protein